MVLETIIEWRDDCPDWKDSGECIEFRTDEKAVVSGILCVCDSFFTGEEEIPIFSVEIGKGEFIPFPWFNGWRFT